MAAKRKLIWKIFPLFLLITALSLLAVSWYASRTMQSFYFDVITVELESRAKLVASHLSGAFAQGDWQQLDNLCRKLGELSDTRITVIDTGGMVLGDSWEDPAAMANHYDRPELQMALAGDTGISRRFSETISKNMLYVAVPLRQNGVITGAVRTALGLTALEHALHAVYFSIAIAGCAVALAAIVFSLLITRRIVQPLGDIQAGAERFARGNLGLRLPAFDTVELDRLAQAMNQMAEQLSSRIRIVNQQRSEAEAILSSMVEGVLAVDTDGNVIRINEAAKRMLAVAGRDVIGINVMAIARYPDLQDLLQQTLDGTEPVSGELIFHNGAERFIHIQAAQLADEAQQQIGAVLVLNDVTQLRKLENLRRDFVANVSHEIRTPITAIQGFVETLLEDAVHDPADRLRFLHIILNQSRRLNNIVEDLLMLSKIESAEAGPRRDFEKRGLGPVLQSAIQVCEAKAQSKSITIVLVCQADVEAQVNVVLFEQAVVNLIDNAVNYSPAETSIQVRLYVEAAEVVVSVQDFGCGIPPEHIPRLFERFYRVDKARSRQVGGTGLGLAIVKHVAQEHGGRVNVISRVGEGSTFSIHLPCNT